jgi:putative transposase
VFFEADDYRPFRRLAAAAARRAGVPVRAYCLMPNHVHLACAGGRGWVAGDLCRGAPALYRGDQHRFRWTGHLFQGRSGAVVMDKPHLLAAAGYIALNQWSRGW